MATLRGGPADGLTIHAGGDVEWVATVVDGTGRPVPDVGDDGTVVTLPSTVGPATEVLLNKPRRRWECYRRVGAKVIELGDIDPREDLPVTEGQITYRWVCDRGTR